MEAVESKLSKVDILRGLITEKMTIAVREVLAVVETTVAGYENEVLLLNQELSLKKSQLDTILEPRVYLNRRDFNDETSVMSSVSSGEVELRHVQNIMKDEDNGASRERTGEHRISEPPTLSREEKLLNQEESDCAFVDLASDSSVSCPERGETHLGHETENDARKTKVKRRRRVPKRYRSNDETDSDREKREEKAWKPTLITNLTSHQKIHDDSHIIKCPVCGKLLKGELEEHMRIHTGEKPYTCKLCGVKFRLRNHLRNHMNSHLGVKPFTCTVCGCKTSCKSHLEMHMRTHTGQKPYKCTLCDKAYTQAHCLKTHMKSHQTEEQTAVDAVA